MRLGHGEAGADRALDQRAQVPLLLRLGRHDVQQVHVALVGRGAVERDRAEQAAPRLLEDDGHLAHAEPQPAPLPRDMRRVEARGARPGPQRVEPVPRQPVVFVHVGLLRDHLVADEGGGALAQVGQLRR